MDFWALLQQYMNPYAVIIGVAVPQFLIHFFPKLGESKTIGNRLMPLVPLATGVAVTLILEFFIAVPIAPLGSVIVKGLVCGIAGVYVSRTFKVSILGV